MKSISFVGTLLGVLLAKVSGAAEVVNVSHDGIEQLANFDDLAQARPGITGIGSDGSSEGSMFASNASGLSRPAAANESSGISYALTSEFSEQEVKSIGWSSTVVGAEDADGIAKSSLQFLAVDRAKWPLVVPDDTVKTASNTELVPAHLASDGSQSVLTSTSLSGFGRGSAPIQASTAVLIALQSTLGSWTEHYEYDALGRLKKVTFANGAVTDYTLDNAGNRTNVNTIVP